MLTITRKAGVLKLVDGKVTHFSTLDDSEGIGRCRDWAKKNGQFIITTKVVDLDQAGFTLTELLIVLGVLCVGIPLVGLVIWVAYHFISKIW